MISKYNKHISAFAFFTLGIALSVSSTFAAQLSKRCPFSCQTENIPKEYCQDWRRGDHCFIDVRGSVVRRPCPFTCRSEGIAKQNCRDWRVGDICYIHDLRSNSPYQSNIHHDFYGRRPKDEGYWRPERYPERSRDDYWREEYRNERPRDDYKRPEPRPEPPKKDLKKPEPRPEPPRKTTGKVTKKPCPYSCRTEGIPKNKCKDWKEGGLCVIERL